MKFTVSWADDYAGFLHLDSEDYEHEVSVDISTCFDEVTEEWDDDKVMELSEQAIKAAFGPSAKIEW